MWSSRSAPSSPRWRVSHFILSYFKVDFLISPLLKGPISLIINSGDRITYLGTRLSIGHFIQIQILKTDEKVRVGAGCPFWLSCVTPSFPGGALPSVQSPWEKWVLYWRAYVVDFPLLLSPVDMTHQMLYSSVNM